MNVRELNIGFGGRPVVRDIDQRRQAPPLESRGWTRPVAQAIARQAIRLEGRRAARGADARRPFPRLARRLGRGYVGEKEIGRPILQDSAGERWRCQGLTEYGDLCVDALGHEGECW